MLLQNAGTLEIGDGFCIRSGRYKRVEISVAPGAHLSIGNNVFINQGARIACSTRIHIGDNCMLGDEVVILDTDYHAAGDADPITAPVHLEARVWLATRVMVLRGVTVGEGSIVGAGAVVTRSLPAHVFAAGMPARVVKQLEQTG